MKKISVLVRNIKQFNCAVSSAFVSRIYFELSDDFTCGFNNIINACKLSGIEIFLALPHVQRDVDIDFVVNFDVSGFLIRTYGQFERFASCGKAIVIDRTLNCFNCSTVNYWLGRGVNRVTLSTELSLAEINNFTAYDCEIVCYGHIHNMITVYCPVKLYSECGTVKDSDSFWLRDDKSNKFYVLPVCRFCYCLILNCNSIFVLNRYNDIKDTDIMFIRLEFTSEEPSLVDDVISAYGNTFCESGALNDDSISRTVKHFNSVGFTYGHFFRAVE